MELKKNGPIKCKTNSTNNQKLMLKAHLLLTTKIHNIQVKDRKHLKSQDLIWDKLGKDIIPKTSKLQPLQTWLKMLLKLKNNKLRIVWLAKEKKVLDHRVLIMKTLKLHRLIAAYLIDWGFLYQDLPVLSLIMLSSRKIHGWFNNLKRLSISKSKEEDKSWMKVEETISLPREPMKLTG